MKENKEGNLAYKIIITVVRPFAYIAAVLITLYLVAEAKITKDGTKLQKWIDWTKEDED